MDKDGQGACILTGAEDEDPDDCTTHDHEEEDGPAEPVLYRTLLTSECLPKVDGSAEAWVQQSTVLTHQLMELMSNLYTLLKLEVPIVLEKSGVGLTLAAIGNIMQQVEGLGFEWMAHHNVTPLSLHTEAQRVARAQLAADPEMPEDIRTELEALVAAPEPSEDDQAAFVFPASGVVH